MDTDTLAVFVAAASAGSLSAAARRLGITPMAATRRLAALEQDVGVRLMHRTTRSVSLTPEGEAFLPHAQALVEGEAAARASLRPATEGASGLLRVTSSAAFGRKVLAPLIPGLLRRHPELRIELDLSDRMVDLVSSGMDLAIRLAPLRDNSMIGRRLAASPRVLCAAPAYLAERGAPATLAELAGHDCLALGGVTHWTFIVAGRERAVRVGGRFTSSAIEALHQACLGGAGIARLAAWNAAEDLRAGRLVAVTLTDAVPEDNTIWAVYPTARQVLPKLRVFVAAVEEALQAL